MLKHNQEGRQTVKTTITIDAVSYDWVDAHDSLQVAHKLVKHFHTRPDIERFIEKALSSDHKAAIAVINDPFINTNDDTALLRHLADRIEKKNLLVQLAPIGNNAPKAQAKPKQPGSDKREGISPLFTGQMREFISQQRSNTSLSPPDKQANANHPTPGAATYRSTFESVTEEKLPQYKYVVEISGPSHSGKQRLLLEDDNGPSVLQTARQDSKAPHRSLVEFKGVTNTPKTLIMDIPMSGGPNLQLPLVSNTLPVNKDKTKPCWDSVIAAIKPLRFLTEARDINQSDILPEGWLYVFWRGRCWRELFVRNNSYRDVALDWHRHTNNNSEPSKRKATGHWLENIWIPLQLDNTAQTGALGFELAFCPTQWPLEWIKSLEDNTAQRKEYCTSLDGLTAYLQQQNFNQSSAVKNNTVISDIQSALLSRPLDTDPTELLCPDGNSLKPHRKNNLAAVYLQPAGDIVRIKITNKKGTPWKGKKVAVKVSGKTSEYTIDNDGFVEVGLLGNQTIDGIDASILDNDSPSHGVNININALDIVSSIKGQQARLNNLEHNAGVEDGLMGKNTRGAIKGFQTQYKLDADGIAGPITQKKLTEIHGS